VDWLQLLTDGPVARVYDSEQLQQEYVLAQTVLERAQALEQPGDQDSHHDGNRQCLGRSSVPLIYDRKMSFNITVTDSNFGDHVVSGIDHTLTTAGPPLALSYVDVHIFIWGQARTVSRGSKWCA
jgi:hypothetical protein